MRLYLFLFLAFFTALAQANPDESVAAKRLAIQIKDLYELPFLHSKKEADLAGIVRVQDTFSQGQQFYAAALAGDGRALGFLTGPRILPHFSPEDQLYLHALKYQWKWLEKGDITVSETFPQNTPLRLLLEKLQSKKSAHLSFQDRIYDLVCFFMENPTFVDQKTTRFQLKTLMEAIPGYRMPACGTTPEYPGQAYAFQRMAVLIEIHNFFQGLSVQDHQRELAYYAHGAQDALGLYNTGLRILWGKLTINDKGKPISHDQRYKESAWYFAKALDTQIDFSPQKAAQARGEAALKLAFLIQKGLIPHRIKGSTLSGSREKILIDLLMLAKSQNISSAFVLHWLTNKAMNGEFPAPLYPESYHAYGNTQAGVALSLLKENMKTTPVKGSYDGEGQSRALFLIAEYIRAGTLAPEVVGAALGVPGQTKDAVMQGIYQKIHDRINPESEIGKTLSLHMADLLSQGTILVDETGAAISPENKSHELAQRFYRVLADRQHPLYYLALAQAAPLIFTEEIREDAHGNPISEEQKESLFTQMNIELLGSPKPRHVNGAALLLEHYYHMGKLSLKPLAELGQGNPEGKALLIYLHGPNGSRDKFQAKHEAINGMNFEFRRRDGKLNGDFLPAPGIFDLGVHFVAEETESPAIPVKEPKQKTRKAPQDPLNVQIDQILFQGQPAPLRLRDAGVLLGTQAEDDYNQHTDAFKRDVIGKINELKEGRTVKRLETLKPKPVLGVPFDLIKQSLVKACPVLGKGIHRIVFSRAGGQLTIYRCFGHYNDNIPGVNQ